MDSERQPCPYNKIYVLCVYVDLIRDKYPAAITITVRSDHE